MGQLVNGTWIENLSTLELEHGKFFRKSAAFRGIVTAEGEQGYRAEPGRYHLYVSLQCPWAWRTIVYRSIKRLHSVIGMTIAIPDGRREGWRFGDDFLNSQADEAECFTHLHQAYVATQADYTGVVSVPVLWDKAKRRIVNNESADIIRMLNSAFNGFTEAKEDYYPKVLQPEIDAKNERLYKGLNNAVYRAGAANTQSDYAEGYYAVFDTLDWAEAILSKSRFLNGDSITETDWRLAASLFRFESVYYPLFRCNKRHLSEFPNLTGYIRELYQYPGVAETVNIRHIVTGYYMQSWNPSGLVPIGPEGFEDWLSVPHHRARLCTGGGRRRH
ncbi:glutathione S-transferase family protein [Pseudomonas caspiana]|nr:glutathione S-transferase C-terminal domain-containing protein [Pseudomonas caspiana]TPG88771.1 glutathione S-transferase family protein [Pseudomonas caspiana]